MRDRENQDTPLLGELMSALMLLRIHEGVVRFRGPRPEEGLPACVQASIRRGGRRVRADASTFLGAIQKLSIQILQDPQFLRPPAAQTSRPPPSEKTPSGTTHEVELR